jgi:hypothetical protein
MICYFIYIDVVGSKLDVGRISFLIGFVLDDS